MDLGSTAFWERLQKDPGRMAHEVCSIDLVNLEITLQHHAALRAWVTAAHETHRILEERKKWELTKTKARILKLAREVKDEFTGKLKTTAVLEAERDDHPEVADAVEALLQQQQTRGTLRAMVEALGDRKDMLVQLSARQRKEMDDT